MKGRLENLGAGISFVAIFYGALRHSAQTEECSEFAGLPSQGCDRQPYEWERKPVWSLERTGKRISRIKNALSKTGYYSLFHCIFKCSRLISNKSHKICNSFKENEFDHWQKKRVVRFLAHFFVRISNIACKQTTYKWWWWLLILGYWHAERNE